MQEPEISRWPLIRSMLIFQIKLAMDAIRDLLLSPVAIICGIVDIFKGHNFSQSYFKKLMELGHQSDLWLNLFGYQDKNDEQANVQSNEDTQTTMNVDFLFTQVESLLKEQHSKGGLTASAKTKIDNYLNKIAENKNEIKSASDNLK
jgi:peptidoglycan hydrolase CwlO-like protein